MLTVKNTIINSVMNTVMSMCAVTNSEFKITIKILKPVMKRESHLLTTSGLVYLHLTTLKWTQRRDRAIWFSDKIYRFIVNGTLGLTLSTHGLVPLLFHKIFIFICVNPRCGTWINLAKSLFSVAPARENPRNPLGLQPKTQRNRAPSSLKLFKCFFPRTKIKQVPEILIPSSLNVALYLT